MTPTMTLPAWRPAADAALALLRSHPRESLGAGLLLLAAGASVAALANESRAVPVRSEALRSAAAPTVADMNPFAVREVAPGEAQALNAAVPLADGPNPSAAPFVLKADSKTYARALDCLTQAIYYEAAREPEEGQRAVAQVVLNRMRHAAYPASVCAVVYQGAERPTGCQFSFTCDGSLYRAPMRGYWDRARRYAHEALQGHVVAAVGNATHYHTNYVLPYWAPTLTKSAVVATHIFYRWAGGWGRPAAFNQKWAKREADPWTLRNAALAAEARHDSAADLELLPEVIHPEIVVQAKRELPPELARLVEAELGPNGQTRVGLTIPNPRRDGKAEIKQPNSALAGKAEGSSSLDWGLTGRGDAGSRAQAPLGRKPDSAPTPSAGGAQ